MMKRYVILALMSLSVALLAAQEEDIQFSSDRPGNSTSVDIMPQWKVQWETGGAFEWASHGTEKTITLNNSLFRVGLTKHAELRFQIDECLTIPEDGEKYAGIANLTIGTKVRIFDGWKGVPKISLLGSLFLPGRSDAHYLPAHLGGADALVVSK